jgi:hypothetical protein
MLSSGISSLVLGVLFIAIGAGLICSLNVNQQPAAVHLETRSAPLSQRIEGVRGVGRFGAAFGGAVLGCLASEGTSAKRAFAVSGSIKSSTLAESKEAVGVVKKCIDSVVDMERAVAAGDYNEVGMLLSGKEFLEFEKAATVLVRSTSSKGGFSWAGRTTYSHLSAEQIWSRNYHIGRTTSIAAIMLASLAVSSKSSKGMDDATRHLQLARGALVDLHEMVVT